MQANHSSMSFTLSLAAANRQRKTALHRLFFIVRYSSIV
jgi:hypothetical protein